LTAHQACPAPFTAETAPDGLLWCCRDPPGIVASVEQPQSDLRTNRVFVMPKNAVTKGGELGRPTIKKTGPMTGAEREARRRKRVGKSINRRRRMLRKQAKEKGRVATQLRRAADAAAVPLPDGMEYRIGNNREMYGDIEDATIPVIITDPPYGRDSACNFHWLGKFSDLVLMQGGSLICYTGQGMLPRDLQILSQYLTYRWTCAMMHNASQQMDGATVFAKWKPVLWFTKGPRRDRTLVPDVMRLEDDIPETPDDVSEVVYAKRDKSEHPWAQGDGGIAQWVHHLSAPGETILDPFAGTGRWGHIVHALGRRWIGCDIELGGTTTIAA
jgi:hypothetical protein